MNESNLAISLFANVSKIQNNARTKGKTAEQKIRYTL
jgi:hypothetical protein